VLLLQVLLLVLPLGLLPTLLPAQPPFLLTLMPSS